MEEQILELTNEIRYNIATLYGAISLSIGFSENELKDGILHIEQLLESLVELLDTEENKEYMREGQESLVEVLINFDRLKETLL